MSNSGQDKVTVHVKVVVEGGRAASVETQSQDGLKLQTQGGLKLLQMGISYPAPCPTDTTIVSQSGGVNYIEAWGDAPSVNGKLPWQVWALAYNSTGVSTLQHPKPDVGAVNTTPDPSTGHWSFLQVDNNPVPGAACDGTPCSSGGSNNSTFLVWYDYGSPSSPNYSVGSTIFHGYCPGSGGAAFAFKPATLVVGSHHLAITLHATFTGALAQLGTVALIWNGVSWVGESAAGGGLVLSLLHHDGAFQLMSAGPGTAFIVAGKPKLCPRFSWTADGMARGALAGHFTVTIVE